MAIEGAKRLVADHDIELWSGERFVVRISHPDTRTGGTVSHEVNDGRLVQKPAKIDLEAEALEALEKARALPHGPERTEALKKAGALQNAVNSQGIAFAKRGRPAKT